MGIALDGPLTPSFHKHYWYPAEFFKVVFWGFGFKQWSLTWTKHWCPPARYSVPILCHTYQQINQMHWKASLLYSSHARELAFWEPKIVFSQQKSCAAAAHDSWFLVFHTSLSTIVHSKKHSTYMELTQHNSSHPTGQIGILQEENCASIFLNVWTGCESDHRHFKLSGQNLKSVSN